MTKEHNHKVRNYAFTLIELLVVISIISLLILIMGSVVTKGMATARSLSCKNKLAQIGKATIMYTIDNQKYPYTYIRDKDGGWSGNVRTYIAPYLYVDLDKEDHAKRQQRMKKMRTWICPEFVGELSGDILLLSTYSGNRYLFLDGGKLDSPNPPVTPLMIPRPSECLLFADGAFSDNPYSAANVFRGIYTNTHKSAANLPVKTDNYESIPSGSFRFRHGNATVSRPDIINAVFADGHVASFKHGDLLNRHISIRY
jgi:prepilin-type N-terminal cleavage/methylation domain-containing protein